ncbi:thiolase family protein [Ruegeria sp.]|uniref:thiolase family protein n=1 Tax=Ruegeria sp. TaxID=1879320 RepID=UPI0023240DB9|nr:thiolase family protein [Ruegeria sp.]MDA7967152.1 thiolase family protein [Ruegeria sp.]
MASNIPGTEEAREVLKKHKIVIAGVGETEQGKIPDRSSFHFLSQASKLAIEDAGIKKTDVDGLVTAFSLVEHTFMHCTTFADYFGMKPKFFSSVAVGGATAVWMAAEAAMAIASGQAEVVLCVRGDNTLSGISSSGMLALIREMCHGEFEFPYGLTTPGGYALAAQRYLHDFGATREQLAAVAVTMRKHAAMKENAMNKEPLTVEEVVNSRIIAEPLTKYDCSIISDGGAAFIVTTEEKAKELGIENDLAYLLGMGQGYSHQYMTTLENLDQIYNAINTSGQKAFQTAGLGVDDVDVAFLYDCFTITVLLELEGLGFVPKGEGGPFALEGRMEIGKDLPVNTHGGLLSQAHLGAMHHVVEATLQLRGDAGPRQVEKPEVALVHGNGGIVSAHSTILLGKEPLS